MKYLVMGLLAMLLFAGCNRSPEDGQKATLKEGRKIMVLTESNFDEKVVNANEVVLVDFWAPWCSPCNMMLPTIEELSAEYDGKATVGKVNIDEERSLADRFKVSAIPALLFFKDGKLQSSMTLEGLQQKEAIAEKLDLLLK